MIKHDSYKPSVPMDNRELRTNILSSEYFNRKCRRCEKFIKKSEILLKNRGKTNEKFTLYKITILIFYSYIVVNKSLSNRTKTTKNYLESHLFVTMSIVIIVHNHMIRYFD